MFYRAKTTNRSSRRTGKLASVVNMSSEISRHINFELEQRGAVKRRPLHNLDLNLSVETQREGGAMVLHADNKAKQQFVSIFCKNGKGDCCNLTEREVHYSSVTLPPVAEERISKIVSPSDLEEYIRQLTRRAHIRSFEATMGEVRSSTGWDLLFIMLADFRSRPAAARCSGHCGEF